jgi:GH15 family glucan-1,4-alpha-glucosidase
MIRAILAPLLSFSLLFSLHAQSVGFPAQWKFMTGDGPAYQAEHFDDLAWDSIEVPAHWEEQGYPGYDGIAWYRTHFSVLPAMLRQEVVLLAGVIDDADETWVNGVLVGKTGKFPPDDQSAWDFPRAYILPKGLLKAQNTLAIRVYDGVGGGGIYQGNIELIPLKQYQQMCRRRLKNKNKWHQLTTSNGLISAVYSTVSGTVEAVYPHIFSAVDSAVLVQPFVSNITPDTQERPTSVRYLGHTHIIEAVYNHFSIYYTASFTAADKIFYAIVRGDPAYVEGLSFRCEWSGRGEVKSLTRSYGKQSEKYVLFGFSDAHHPESGITRAVERTLNAAGSLVDAEVDYMKGVFHRCNFPGGITRSERALLEQSVSVLKMAQVSDEEVFPLAKGQVLASLRPGVWSVSWVRDAAFAIGAMTKLGLYEEARKGLLFMLLAAPSNQYKHYIHTDGNDYGIGVDYRISVTRYFGNGREESDYADNRGPNIEIDDFGLFLIALSDYVVASGDTAFFHQWQTVLETTVADAIVHNINEKDIIRPDSGPWEHHLPGRSFAFTAGVCGVGLEKFAALQQRMGSNYLPYLLAAQRLYRGVLHNMGYENRLIKGNAEDQSPSDHYFFDGATFELFAGGFIREKALFLSHIAAYDQELRVKVGEKAGYIRFNSSDAYENQEWPFAGLRVAVAQTIFGNRQEAKHLIGRVTNFARHNYHLIPEIVALQDGQYKGAVPMVGYGAGAYILALVALHAPR